MNAKRAGDGRRNVLILGEDAGRAASSIPWLNTTPSRSLLDAARQLEHARYDAIFVRIRDPREMPMLLALRSTVPHIPVFALLPDDPHLGALALESGATEILTGDVTWTRALESTEDLLHRARSTVATGMQLAAETSVLLRRTLSLARRLLVPLRIDEADFRPLLVEDDEDAAFLVERAFARLGLPLPLPLLRDGEEAVGQLRQALRSRRPFPTLVLLDLHLPARNGFEVLEWARSAGVLERTTVMVLTASAIPEDHARALALGAAAVYVKPVGFEELVNLVRSIVVRWSHIFKSLKSGVGSGA